ncbi:twin-arginine translocation signal domain-containing protein, partial [Listeria monocytogenes]|nr:twin-arginine translocation signal domain-containing protein [Listeria monocytogenes]
TSNWRRRFLQGLGAAAGLAGLSPRLLFAQQADRRSLRGTEFDLVIGPTPVNYTGAERIATAVNGQVPAPTLYWNEGDTVT